MDGVVAESEPKMTSYSISRPKPDVIRVAFPNGWDATAESKAMFRDVLSELDDSDVNMTVMVVAGSARPEYAPDALSFARGVLTHDRLKKMVVVADDAQLAVNHMGVTRGERGLAPIPMLAFDSEAEALASL